GTPYEAFRSRVCAELDHHPEKSFYLLGAEGTPCMDITTGKINGEDALDSGRIGHQLIEVLLRDFYRPVKLCEIFAQLFPDEHFDIFSSPNRVHQLLFRTRHWIEQRQLPFSITEEHGYYTLQRAEEFSFLIPYERRPVAGYNQYLKHLEKL